MQTHHILLLLTSDFAQSARWSSHSAPQSDCSSQISLASVSHSPKVQLNMNIQLSWIFILNMNIQLHSGFPATLPKSLSCTNGIKWWGLSPPVAVAGHHRKAPCRNSAGILEQDSDCQTMYLVILHLVDFFTLKKKNTVTLLPRKIMKQSSKE